MREAVLAAGRRPELTVWMTRLATSWSSLVPSWDCWLAAFKSSAKEPSSIVICWRSLAVSSPDSSSSSSSSSSGSDAPTLHVEEVTSESMEAAEARCFFCCFFRFLASPVLAFAFGLSPLSIQGSKGTGSEEPPSSSLWTSQLGSAPMAQSTCSTSFTSCCSMACTEEGSMAQRSFHRALGSGARPLFSESRSGSTSPSSLKMVSPSRKVAFIAITGMHIGSTRIMLGFLVDLAICHVNSKAEVKRAEAAKGSAAVVSLMPKVFMSICFWKRACRADLILSTRHGSSKRIKSCFRSKLSAAHRRRTSSALARRSRGGMGRLSPGGREGLGAA
mmetsp:Transcript_58379/g.170714  ORF Transcript_58379/g.170714 Transcript_58379/m.170714 type:complete len:332 (+) Transcript_58379:211-1206(+)